MSDLPSRVHIHEEGPREGFQIEPGPIETADKIRLVEALADTGLEHIQVCSFVNAKVVPGWADADATVSGLKVKEGVHYTALWFNDNGLNRALAHRNVLSIEGTIALAASEAFTRKNLNRTHSENLAAVRQHMMSHIENGVPVGRVGVMAAFGCNYHGDITAEQVVSALTDGLAVAADVGGKITDFTLADTMGWGNPASIKRVVGEVRSRWPDQRITLHLHDTRGLAVANAHAALRMGIDRFDATVGGLGGCPFAGQKGAAGNICSEELVFLCQELGIETGVDLDALIEVGRMAEAIVGHQLPSEIIHAGNLNAFRKSA